MSMNPEELAKLRRRERRTERKAAQRLGISTEQFRKEHGSRTSTPAVRMGVGSQKTQAAKTLAIKEYAEQLIEALELSIEEKPETSFWLGFSIAEIARLHPDPIDGAHAVLQKANERNVPIRRIAIFKGFALGIGPIKEVHEED